MNRSNPTLPLTSTPASDLQVESSRSRTWRLWRGAAWTLATALFVEVISRTVYLIPNPGAIYLIAVAYTAVTGGSRAALFAAFVAFLAAILFLADPEFSFHYLPATVSRLIVMAVSLLALSLLAGGAKTKSDVLLAERVASQTAQQENEKMQAAVRASEERLRLAHEAAQIGTWDFYPQTGLFEWDETCRKIYGIAPGRTINYEAWAAGIHPDDKERVEKVRRDALSGTALYELEYQIVGVDFPVERWIAVRGQIFRNEKNEVTRFLGVAQDVTERKHAEETLVRREQEFAALADNAPDIISRFGPDLQHLYINRAIEDATGFPRERFLGKTARELSSPRNIDKVGPWEETLQSVFVSGEPAVVETPFIHKDRTTHTLQIRVVPEFDANGVVTSVLTVGRDVTDKERAADLLRESLQTLSDTLEAKEAAQDALLISEARARRVTDSGIVGIIHWHLDGKITYANDAFLSMTGYTKADTQAGLLDFHAMTPPEWRGRNSEALQSIRINRFTPPYEKEYFHKNGQRVPIVIGGALFDDSDEEGVSFVLDISHRKALEDERDAMLKKQQRIAETLQHSLLIDTPPGTFPGLEVATWYEAAWDDMLIGGDFYDAFALSYDKVALVVGDATGKGLQAAAQTAEVKFALRAFLREGCSAGEAMVRLNRFLLHAQTFDGRAGDALICMSLVIIEPKTGIVEVAAGGMEPPLLLPLGGSPHEVSVGGPIVGMSDNATFDTETLCLSPGDTLLLATDGITEARQKGAGRAFFGYDGFAQSAHQAMQNAMEPGEDALKRGGRQIVSDARRFAGGTLHDDVCLLLVRLCDA